MSTMLLSEMPSVNWHDRQEDASSREKDGMLEMYVPTLGRPG